LLVRFISHLWLKSWWNKFIVGEAGIPKDHAYGKAKPLRAA